MFYQNNDLNILIEIDIRLNKLYNLTKHSDINVLINRLNISKNQMKITVCSANVKSFNH